MRFAGETTIVVGLVLLLAGLDIVESVFAKEWAIRRTPWLLLAGLTASVLMFLLFVVAIGYTEMSTVTIGWIVLMQAGLMVTETVRYDVSHTPDRWLAMGAIVALLTYLVASPATA
jgi:hypothetical protein